MNHYVIERMNQEEMQLAIDWATKEGWNPGLHDAECFFAADPQGFFAGKLNGTIIAMGSAVVYDEQFAFCGFYRVDPAFREQGYGLALTKARLAYVGKRNVGIDGVLSMLKKYANLGYRFAHNNARYELQLKPDFIPDKAIIPCMQLDFSQLCQYDRLYFPAPREAFLRCWLQQTGGQSLAYYKNNRLQGYGVIRPCQQGFKIGPLFAENPLIAKTLLSHLSQISQDQTIYLDIPENNINAVRLVTHLNMTKVFATARMYLREMPQIDHTKIYGITTFELG